MRSKLFKEGGLYKTRQVSPTKYEMSIPMPEDEDGRTARQCPNPHCSPGYFKIKSGTGLTEELEVMYCPYCHGPHDSDEYTTEAQLEYAQAIMEREAHDGMQDMVADALGMGRSRSRKIDGGLISIDMKLESSPPPRVHHPFEEMIQRDVVCPHCGLDHAVFGIAIWCPDCGEDIFLTHVDAELAVITAMLSDIDRREEVLGRRVAARDLENGLEDTVSIFEAVLKAIALRKNKEDSPSDEDLQKFLKKIGMNFQSVDRAFEFFQKAFGLDLSTALEPKQVESLRVTFEKRHPITHNLGVVDRKYMERGYTAEREGREIRISRSEIESAIASVSKIFKYLHESLIEPAGEGDAPS